MAKTVLVSFFLVLLGVFLQTTIIRSSFPSAFIPDLVIILIVAIAFQNPNKFGLVIAFCLGLLVDFASGQFIGVSGIAAVVCFTILVNFANYKSSGFFSIILIVFFINIVKGLTIFAVLSVFSQQTEFQSVIKSILFESLSTAIFAPFCFRYFYKLLG